MTTIRPHHARAADQSGDRNHVKKDLDAYVCVFDNCTEPYQLYASSEEWLAHMSSQHRTRWQCTERDHRPILFETRQQFMDHMEAVHPGRFKREQLGFVADSCAQALTPTITNCPFCSESAEDLDAHVRQHLHCFVLQSLPWPEDLARGTDHASVDAAGSSSTSKGLDRDTLRGSFGDDDTPWLDDLMQDSDPPLPYTDARSFDGTIDAKGNLEAWMQETDNALLGGDNINVTVKGILEANGDWTDFEMVPTPEVFTHQAWSRSLAHPSDIPRPYSPQTPSTARAELGSRTPSNFSDAGEDGDEMAADAFPDNWPRGPKAAAQFWTFDSCYRCTIQKRKVSINKSFPKLGTCHLLKALTALTGNSSAIHSRTCAGSANTSRIPGRYASVHF